MALQSRRMAGMSTYCQTSTGSLLNEMLQCIALASILTLCLAGVHSMHAVPAHFPAVQDVLDHVIGPKTILCACKPIQ